MIAVAQTIHCDVQGCEAIADILVTHIQSGQVDAYCMPCYIQLMLSFAAQMQGEEEQETNQDDAEQVRASGED